MRRSSVNVEPASERAPLDAVAGRAAQRQPGAEMVAVDGGVDGPSVRQRDLLLAEDEVAVQDDDVVARDPARPERPEAGEVDRTGLRVDAGNRAEREPALRDHVVLDPPRHPLDRAGAADA